MSGVCICWRKGRVFYSFRARGRERQRGKQSAVSPPFASPFLFPSFFLKAELSFVSFLAPSSSSLHLYIGDSRMWSHTSNNISTTQKNSWFFFPIEPSTPEAPRKIWHEDAIFHVLTVLPLVKLAKLCFSFLLSDMMLSALNRVLVSVIFITTLIPTKPSRKWIMQQDDQPKHSSYTNEWPKQRTGLVKALPLILQQAMLASEGLQTGSLVQVS